MDDLCHFDQRFVHKVNQLWPEWIRQIQRLLSGKWEQYELS